jgi:uncharacterized repeat protein (TIGR04052 family)
MLSKIASTSIILAMSGFAFAGCGSSGSDNNTTNELPANTNPVSSTTTYSGVVSDGYIQGAIVCLDLAGDGVCDATDPQATTDANGAYTITTSETIPTTAKLLASGGTDTFTGESFNGKLETPLDLKDGTSNHITPLTTLVSAKVANDSTTTQNALSTVASSFGVDASMIRGDAIAKLADGSDDEKTKAARAMQQIYAIQKTVEMIKANSNATANDIFKAIAKAQDLNVTNIQEKGGSTLLGISPTNIQNAVDTIKDMSITNTTTLEQLKTKQKAIQVITEVTNANGTITLDGKLLTNLETAIGNNSVDIKAFAQTIKGSGIGDINNSQSLMSTITNTPRIAGERTIAIDFGAVVGTQGELVCSENGAAKVYTNLGDTNASGSISDFRFFVSEVKLKMSDDTTKTLKMFNNHNQYDDKNNSVALLDFEDATGNCMKRGNSLETYKTIVGTVASDASVTGVEFTIGVPLALNHVEFPDIKALTATSMAWSWAAGRKFTKLEINPTDELNATGDIFNFHLGSTGCSDNNADGITDDCLQPNRVKLVFDNFNPETQKVVLDYSKLLTHVDITHDGGKAKGCMSGLNDPECMSTTACQTAKKQLPTITWLWLHN